MSTIRLVTDSACDLPQALVDKHGITVVPLSIRFGDEELVDREELSNAEFWARCAQSATLPSTAAPAPGAFEHAYRRLADEGATGIVVINLSGAMSATIQSAELGVRAYVDGGGTVPIRVVDSRSCTMGLGTIVLAAAEAAEAGADVDAIAGLANQLADRTRVFGALDTLENLKKGGRIGGAKAMLATALAIKPIIQVVDGKVEEYGKQRTRSKALKFLADKVAEFTAGDPSRIEHLAVLQADCNDVDEFVAMLRPHYPGEIVVGEIGPVVGSHAGRGTIGVAFHVADR